jgi:TRAP-type C4-dicarboxylate transport system permease small subunit
MPTCPGSFGGVHTLKDLECIIIRIFNLIIPFAGVAAFIVLLVGGFQYLASGGDPKKTQQAQGIITGALIGIIATLAVWFIFQLINNLTGLDLLEFEIPS